MRERGQRVSYPDLPEPFDPEPGQWLAALREELAAMDGERVVLCHSLACLLWLQHARSGATDAADRVLLVAPPAAWEVPAVARFRADGVQAADVGRAAGSTLMFCGAPDPYCPGSATTVYGSVLRTALCVPGAGHVNPDAGYGPWPAVEQWALGEREDIGPN